MRIPVLFVHGRPAAHPMHQDFARSIDSTFQLVDPVIRWHDIAVPFWRRYFAFIVNALNFPSSSVILSEGFHFSPLLAKWFSKTEKVVYLLDDEGLYFVYSKKYNLLTRILVRFFLQKADALICIGDYQTQLAKDIIVNKTSIFSAINGISSHRFESLESLLPPLLSRNILFIGHGPDGWRTYYKGLDIAIEALYVLDKMWDGKFTIIGNWTIEEQNTLLYKYPKTFRDKIVFEGIVSDLAPYFLEVSLYLHPARGEAWGISITEAMLAGIPALVSTETGAKQLVKEVSEDLICTVDPLSVAKGIESYFNKPLSERKELSMKSKTVAAKYNYDAAIQSFQRAWQKFQT